MSEPSYRITPEKGEEIRQQVREAEEEREAKRTAVGVYRKYHVERLDDTAGKHADCRYFVLDPQHDPLARKALRSYGQLALEAGYEDLALDIFRWVASL